jgi:hypothetical protein
VVRTAVSTIADVSTTTVGKVGCGVGCRAIRRRRDPAISQLEVEVATRG